MEISYNPTLLAPAVASEIKYYMALAGLKKLRRNGIITAENYRAVCVGVAEIYGVLPYKD